MILTFCFPAVKATCIGFKLIGWVLEIGTSIVIAHISSKYLNSSANSSDNYFKSNKAQLKKEYDQACEFLGVDPDENIDSIKVAAGHLFIAH
jgi:hypothetical protein